MSILILANPTSGSGTSLHIINTYVLPLLSKHSIQYTLHATTSAEDAGKLAQKHVDTEHDRGVTPVILVAGGDGTLHDIINSLALPAAIEPGSSHAQGVEFVFIPSGTANALYNSFYPPPALPITSFVSADPDLLADINPEDAYKLQSLLAFVHRQRESTTVSGLKSLTISRTQIFPPPPSSDPNTDESVPIPIPTHTILSIVVASAALHASILDSAEKHRETVPGIERFKIAAQENITNWYRGRVRLLGESVLRYNPRIGGFEDLTSFNGGGPTLDGPFVYVLSTVNVDRLEPTFVPTPLFRTIPSAAPEPQTVDLVILRPLRDPGLGNVAEEAKAATFVPRIIEWFGGMYQEGKHISMEYEGDSENEERRYVTEYFRVSGWEWEPEVSASSILLVLVLDLNHSHIYIGIRCKCEPNLRGRDDIACTTRWESRLRGIDNPEWACLQDMGLGYHWNRARLAWRRARRSRSLRITGQRRKFVDRFGKNAHTQYHAPNYLDDPGTAGQGICSVLKSRNEVERSKSVGLVT